MPAHPEEEWIEVFTESEVEELRRQAAAEDAADREVDTWTADTRVGLTARAYDPTPADLAAQAAADREQAEAEADYRTFARQALRVAAGRCRCRGSRRAPCLACRVTRWLALGL
jgi:hypothetical protein